MTQNKPEENNEQPSPVNDWEKSFDEKFPELFYYDDGHGDANQDSYTTCQEEIKSFIRTQIDLAYERGDKGVD